MGEMQTGIAVLALMGVAILMVVVICHFLGLWTWTITWLSSTSEEKIGLTRIKGHFNANGYLLDATGSFKRFDAIDRDYRRVTLTSLEEAAPNSPPAESPPAIPPQPLRLAPAAPQSPSHSQTSLPEIREESENGPFSRQTSQSSQSSAASQFAPTSTPPPSPITPRISPKQGVNFTLPSVNVAKEVEEAVAVVEQNAAALKRAISCDSVCSDTSVVLADLEEPNITGCLCIGLEYDSECCDLAVSVLEAKDLVCQPSLGSTAEPTPMDTYVRVLLLPEKECSIQTRVCRHSNSPSYKERFIFGIHPREAMQRALAFHVFSTDRLSHTLVGEAELRLGDVSLRQPVTTWLTLTDTGQKGTEFGEVMFSLSYLPTAERLTVVIVKARNLRPANEKEPGDAFVKVYLLQHGKKVHKKKTSTKRGEKSPIFNEAMIFSVPAHSLQTIQLRVTVAETESHGSTKALSIGHVIIGAQASGRALSHWNQMLSTLRKPVAMWHPLRKLADK